MKSKLSIVLILMGLLLLSACAEKEKEQIASEAKQKKQMTMSETSIDKVESELVRKGVIDVKAIDKNNDGKVYECPMNWNVLSDQQSDCPVCGMEMKEFTIADVNNNLNKHGYDHK